MRKIILILSLALTGFAQPYSPIPMHDFDDAISHWQLKNRDPYPRYNLNQITEIADNILLLQHNNGGWVQNLDPARILNEQEIESYKKAKTLEDSSFDNRNVFSQIEYLMNVFEQTKEVKYKNSAQKGLEYLLSKQMPNCGGWPHSLPPTQSYHHKLTIADEVFSGNLRLLRKISTNKAPFRNLDKAAIKNAKLALEKGDECLLRLQVKQNGVLTGWAGQYDPITFLPSQGRTFELPSIVSQETVEVLRYLMSIERPSKAQINSIESGIAWLKKSAIKDHKYETFDTGVLTKFPYHTTSIDRRLVEVKGAPPVWARFYDLNDNTIVLATRESVRVQKFSDIPIERRSGYSWYGYWPEPLLSVEYPAWKKRLGRK